MHRFLVHKNGNRSL